VYFFFQAEDGIRDWSVTGVQTCALPISASGDGGALRNRATHSDLLVAIPGRIRQHLVDALRRRTTKRCEAENRRKTDACRSGHDLLLLRLAITSIPSRSRAARPTP